MNDNRNNGTSQVGQYRPSLCFYHANGKGTGSAAKFCLHPAHDNVEGCFMMTIANQKTIADRRRESLAFATFDWQQAVTVKLDFSDLCQILQVFCGECETINGDRGLVHRSANYMTTIRMKHFVEPKAGYIIDVYRAKVDSEGESFHAHMFFNAAEALGLSKALSGSMSIICFGIPMVIPRVATSERKVAKDERDASAA